MKKTLTTFICIILCTVLFGQTTLEEFALLSPKEKVDTYIQEFTDPVLIQKEHDYNKPRLKESYDKSILIAQDYAEYGNAEGFYYVLSLFEQMELMESLHTTVYFDVLLNILIRFDDSVYNIFLDEKKPLTLAGEDKKMVVNTLENTIGEYLQTYKVVDKTVNDLWMLIEDFQGIPYRKGLLGDYDALYEKYVALGNEGLMLEYDKMPLEKFEKLSGTEMVDRLLLEYQAEEVSVQIPLDFMRKVDLVATKKAQTHPYILDIFKSYELKPLGYSNNILYVLNTAFFSEIEEGIWEQLIPEYVKKIDTYLKTYQRIDKALYSFEIQLWIMHGRPDSERIILNSWGDDAYKRYTEMGYRDLTIYPYL